MAFQQYRMPTSPGVSGQPLLSNGASGNAALSVGVLGNAGGGLGTTIPIQNTYTLAYSGVSGFPISAINTPAYLEYTLGTNLAALLAAGGAGYLSVNLSGIALIVANLAIADSLSFYLGTNQSNPFC